MLKECIEVFQEELSRKGENLILDTYVPADGTYLIINRDGSLKGTVEIRIDKKTKEINRLQPFFREICFYDYHSQLISMNKPVDGKKIIHSNNYLSFFVKKDSIVSGKLTEQIIDEYYETLEDPIEKKYKKSKKACKLYELFEEQYGTVDKEEVERKKEWIKDHIFSLNEIDMSRKDYLKIFFEEDEQTFVREGKRYFLPNIYNSNDYNVEIENEIYGIPDNNLGMNAKKPFLSIKTRKYPAPYLLNGEQVMIQKKFFDYLMNLACAGQCNIYVDTDEKRIKPYKNGEIPERVEAGFFLRIKKGKEVEIQSQDNISGYYKKIQDPFIFQDISRGKYRKHPEYLERYHSYYDRLEVAGLINEVFFSNWLAGNYFTDASEISVKDDLIKQSILFAREAVFDWTYKGTETGFYKVLEKVSLNLIKDAVLKDYTERALLQLNLRWSFREYYVGGMNMAEIIRKTRENMKRKVFADTVIPVENDEEYFYAVGQLVSYLLSLSKSKGKNQSLLNPFLNAKNDEVIKRRILQIYKKYNYRISENSKRVKNMLAMVEGYTPDEKVNQEMIILGYASDNLVYTKEEKENE